MVVLVLILLVVRGELGMLVGLVVTTVFPSNVDSNMLSMVLLLSVSSNVLSTVLSSSVDSNMLSMVLLSSVSSNVLSMVLSSSVGSNVLNNVNSLVAFWIFVSVDNKTS